ncbi:MAG: hypothetical protein IPK32_14515 [Verrucomicrobiaceae bacterium]|nr:hypothetical protein [Verrucomicrobiaceae bacterium]
MLPRIIQLLCIMCLFLLDSVRAADLNTISGLQVQNGVVTVEFADNPGVYYLLEHSHDLANWAPADMSLGIDSVLDLAPGVTKGFFRAVPYSKFSRRTRMVTASTTSTSSRTPACSIR